MLGLVIMFVLLGVLAFAGIYEAKKEEERIDKLIVEVKAAVALHDSLNKE